MSVNTKKRVFVSYAHKDAAAFVARLTSSLEMYVDVFWDVKLQAGEFSPQLEQAIVNSNLFVVVMSQTQQNSQACQRELDIARKNNRTIIPLRIYDNHKDDDLEKLQYADFTQNFDEGFRRLTYLLLGERLSSWEYLAVQSDGDILESLHKGIIPGIISKEMGDWVIVDQLWFYFSGWVSQRYGDTILLLSPRTPNGVVGRIAYLRQMSKPLNDVTLLVPADMVNEIVGDYLHNSRAIKDTDHESMGKIAFNAVGKTKEFLLFYTEILNNVPQFARFQGYDFDAAEKIRELIALYSQRSRHLY